MKMRKKQNLIICRKNQNENWMAEKLRTSGHRWSRQAQWGWRLFDFWNHELGIAIEVDGPNHDKAKDAEIDALFFKKSGIVTLRVRNKNESDAAQVLLFISNTNTWNDRRLAMGLSVIRNGRVRSFQSVTKAVARMGHLNLNAEYGKVAQ